MYRLFEEFAHRYDLHTPPDHYLHDHAFVLEQAATLGNPCRLLDVGCGTGVLVQKARQAGILATGIDASEAMIRVAEKRLGQGAVSMCRMQDIAAEPAYDFIVSLSWTINYCESRADLLDVLQRMHQALRPGGRILLQVAHAAHVNGRQMEDREPGPDGKPDDVTFLYRFLRLDGDDWPMQAEYGYACTSQNERLSEKHLLRMTDAREVAQCARQAGFVKVDIYNSWRRDPFVVSSSPFVTGVKEPQME
jgi:SAM-dependent methyltransferase